jgi:predicted transcriptional regulator
MSTLLTLKIDQRMKNAVKKLADSQFISSSAVVKQAIERHLKDHGIDWRKEKKSKK